MAKNKKAKIVDLAPKAEFITKEELTELQALVGSLDQHYREIGILETRKHGFNHTVRELQEKMQVMQVALKEVYGNIDIDITNGAIKEAKSAEADS